MTKTILIIIISVTLFGWFFFIIVRNSLKNKLDVLVEQEKEIYKQKIVASLEAEQRIKDEEERKK
jgi:hypothetical protein